MVKLTNTPAVQDEEIEEGVDPGLTQAPTPSQATIKEIVKVVRDDPSKLAEMVVKVYREAYRDGLKDGLSLERRPEKKKGWLD